MSDEANTTGVEAATDEGGQASTGTVLTGDNMNSEAGTQGQQAEGGSQDPGAEGTQGQQAEGGEGAGIDTGEGSQTPPDTYADFSLPNGMPLDDALLAEATPLFKELGLTQEQAQKLVDFQAKQVQASSQSQVDAFNQLMQDWREKSQNDKEFGGDKFDESIAVARSAIDKFGTPELKQLLEEHGVGNHPEVIRFMVKVGKLTAEDVPGTSGAQSTPEQDRVSQLYPNDRNSA